MISATFVLLMASREREDPSLVQESTRKDLSPAVNDYPARLRSLSHYSLGTGNAHRLAVFHSRPVL